MERIHSVFVENIFWVFHNNKSVKRFLRLLCLWPFYHNFNMKSVFTLDCHEVWYSSQSTFILKMRKLGPKRSDLTCPRKFSHKDLVTASLELSLPNSQANGLNFQPSCLYCRTLCLVGPKTINSKKKRKKVINGLINVLNNS